MNTKQYLFVAAVAIATFVATTEAQVSILGPELLNNLCVAKNKKYFPVLAPNSIIYALTKGPE